MHAHRHHHSPWKRFYRKYGVGIFLACIVIGVIMLVGLLMWVLTSSDWRVRW